MRTIVLYSPPSHQLLCSLQLRSCYVILYRCLSGAFQSDALVVPRGCKFSHTYNEGKCSRFADWHKLAIEACTNQSSMTLQSYGMLLPCGTDMWSGVEHVCCPQGLYIL